MDDQMTAVRRISHYSSDMDILLVGEGDFSFATALARAFQHAPRLFATSLDSREMLHIKYGELIMERRLGELGAKGVVVLNEVDLRTVLQNPSLCHLSFDRIVYNFPHSGFLPGKKECTKSLIRRHRQLMRAYFKSASRLLKVDGEVHVAQHMCEPYSEWRLEEEAAKSGLKLHTWRPFKAKVFSGYVSRRGDGEYANGTFPRRNPVTFIFFLPKSSPPLHIVPSSLANTLPSLPRPPSNIVQPLSAHTIPLHSPSPHTKRSPKQKKPPSTLCKAHSSISIPCPRCITPRPPPSSTIYSHSSDPPLTGMTCPTPPALFSHPPPCKLSPPHVIKPSLSQAISSDLGHLSCLNTPPLQKPPRTPAPKYAPPPTPCISTPSPPQHPYHASNIITTPSRSSVLPTFEAVTRPLVFAYSECSKTSSFVSYTNCNTFNPHQLINSCKLVGSHQDSYKLDHPPKFNNFFHDEHYRLLSSDDHIISELDHHKTSESTSCTSFWMWMMSCCMSRKANSLT